MQLGPSGFIFKNLSNQHGGDISQEGWRLQRGPGDPCPARYGHVSFWIMAKSESRGGDGTGGALSWDSGFSGQPGLFFFHYLVPPAFSSQEGEAKGLCGYL